VHRLTAVSNTALRTASARIDALHVAARKQNPHLHGGEQLQLGVLLAPRDLEVEVRVLDERHLRWLKAFISRQTNQTISPSHFLDQIFSTVAP